MYICNQKSPYAHSSSLPIDAITLSRGFWDDRKKINRTTSLQEGFLKLNKHGNLDNLRLAINKSTGEYQGPQFMDSDIYKWLEAVFYDLTQDKDEDLLQKANECIALLEKVQQPDGYLNSYWQFVKPGQRWTDLETGHELYCAGHLIEAALAMLRSLGERRLLDIAIRVADNIVATFGVGKYEATGGHPEIELALVELYRETGNKSYLDMALFFIDQRGKNIMGGTKSHFNSSYFQDRVPLREAQEVEGHAVRQLYLLSGVTDIYMETGEYALLKAMQRLWRNMTGRKMHITGGFGARHEGESFGDEFELTSDRCYCETCATIAAIMWNWRMLLATGEGQYADLIERCLYNGFLSGISLDGKNYFYVNPLQSRGGIERVEWYDCACCPPNIMRLISMIENHVASENRESVYVHQYLPATVKTRFGSLVIDTQYPASNKIDVKVIPNADEETLSLRLRIPDWCEDASLSLNNEKTEAVCKPGTYVEIKRKWSNQDRVELTLPMIPRVIEPDNRIDAVRGSLALEYGPFVYCIEEVDHPGTDIDDIRISPDAQIETVFNKAMAGGITVLKVPAIKIIREDEDKELYSHFNTHKPVVQSTTLTAVPYFTWANRGAGKMRTWIPRL
jgi:DUF1680 family protein